MGSVVYNSWEKRCQTFSLQLLLGYILFSIKVFLLVTKHEPEAIEQQGELQNDGSRCFRYLYNNLEEVEKRLKTFSIRALHGNYTKIKVSDNPTQ